MKRMLEKYPPEDFWNLLTYGYIGFGLILIAEIWIKCLEVFG